MGKNENFEFDPENNILEVNQDYEKILIEKISAKKTQLETLKAVNKQQIKTMVKLYYETQNLRLIANGTVNAAKKNGDEDSIINAFLADVIDYKTIEHNITEQLKAICLSDPVGRWLLKITGIGPVLAAGVMAYFDVTKANYATSFISYAGLNDNNRPWLGKEKSKEILEDLLQEHNSTEITDEIMYEYSAITQWGYNVFKDSAYNGKKKTWSKTEIIKTASKIPYNKELKSLMWKVGQSFVWQKNRPQSVYGKLLKERMDYEIQNNENGVYADYAAKMLETYNFGKDTEAYKAYIQGKLPPAHITARSIRWVEKIFISHLFEEMYRVKYNAIPPRYYALEHLEGHHTEIEPEVPYTSVTNTVSEVEQQKTKEILDLEAQERAELEEIRKKYAMLKERQKHPEKFEETIVEDKPKRGRSKKTEEVNVEEAPKKRGRPKKNQ